MSKDDWRLEAVRKKVNKPHIREMLENVKPLTAFLAEAPMGHSVSPDGRTHCLKVDLPDHLKMTTEEKLRLAMTEQRGVNNVHKALEMEADDTSADVRGDHYAKHGIDPWGYGMLASLDPLQFSVVKYVTRFRDKGGLDDLRKAEKALKRLIAFDYGSAAGE